MLAAQALIALLAAYFACGTLFAAAFAWRGVERIDSQARGAGLGFRILIVPGSAAFWPWLLYRWVQGGPDPPSERNAHRTAALREVRPRGGRP